MVPTRRRRVVAGVVVATLALVLMTVVVVLHHHDDGPGAPATAGAVQTGEPSSFIADRYGGMLRPARLLTASRTHHLTSTPWTLQKVTGQALWIEDEVGSSNCNSDRGFYLRETATAVLVGHYVHEATGGGMCFSDLTLGHGMVTLSRPLGARTVQHVAVEPPG